MAEAGIVRFRSESPRVRRNDKEQETSGSDTTAQESQAQSDTIARVVSGYLHPGTFRIEVKVSWANWRDKLTLLFNTLSLYLMCLFGSLVGTVALTISVYLLTINAFEALNLSESSWLMWELLQVCYPTVVLLSFWINVAPLFSALRESIYDCLSNVTEGSNELTHRIRSIFIPQGNDQMISVDPSDLLLPLLYYVALHDFAERAENLEQEEGGVEGFWVVHLHYHIVLVILILSLSICYRRLYIGTNCRDAVIESIVWKTHVLIVVTLICCACDFYDSERRGINTHRGLGYAFTHICFNYPATSVHIYLAVRVAQAFFHIRQALAWFIFSSVLVWLIPTCWIKLTSKGIFPESSVFGGLLPLTLVLLVILQYLIGLCQNHAHGAKVTLHYGCGTFLVFLFVSAVFIPAMALCYPKGAGIAAIEANRSDQVSISHFGMKHTYKINTVAHSRVPLKPWIDDGYDLCETSYYDLSALDLAKLSQFAYFDWANPEHKHFLKHATKVLFHNQRVSVHGAESLASLYSFDFPDSKLTVFAVRGTDPLSLRDMVQDIILWLEPTAVSILQLIFPLASFWPGGTVARYILAADLFRSLFRKSRGDSMYYLDLETHIRDVVEARRNVSRGWRFMITGHSLGGGLAGILGARLHMKSVTFSAPGLFQTRKKFGIRMRDLVRYHTNIVPTEDLVPSFDQQFGTIQPTICHRPHVLGFLVCHTMGSMICDLMARCGDRHGRYETKGCTFDENSFLDDTEEMDKVGTALNQIVKLLRRVPVVSSLFTHSKSCRAGDACLADHSGHGSEQRQARDGKWYTWKEFQNYYGHHAAEIWNRARTSGVHTGRSSGSGEQRQARNGKWYTWWEFRYYYGHRAAKMWNVARRSEL